MKQQSGERKAHNFLYCKHLCVAFVLSTFLCDLWALCRGRLLLLNLVLWILQHSGYKGSRGPVTLGLNPNPATYSFYVSLVKLLNFVYVSISIKWESMRINPANPWKGIVYIIVTPNT